MPRAQRRRGGQRGEVGRGACRSLRGESPEPPSRVAGSFWKQRGVSGREATAGVQERASWMGALLGTGVEAMGRGCEPDQETYCPALLCRRAS